MADQIDRAVSDVRLRTEAPQLNPALVQVIDVPPVQLSAASSANLSQERVILSWYASTKVGNELAGRFVTEAHPEGDVVILGDVLNISSARWMMWWITARFTDPHIHGVPGAKGRMFIVVDTLRIDGVSQLRVVSASSDQLELRAPSVVICARKAELGPLASLVILAEVERSGGVPNEGGEVSFYVNEVTRDGTPVSLSVLGEVVTTKVPYSGVGEATLLLRELKDSYEGDAVPLVVWNLWKDGFWRHVRSLCFDAIQQQDRKQLVRSLRRYQQGAYAPTLPEFQSAFAKLILNFELLRSFYVLDLWHRQESVVAPSGLARPVDLFVAGASLQNYVAPTDVLLYAYQIGGRQKVGFLVPDANADEVTLLFDAEMAIPDWLAVALRKKLAATHEELSGIFDEWVVAPMPDSFPNGVKRVKVTVLSQTWRWEVTLSGSLAPFAMAQLASAAGLPISFDWSFSGRGDVKGRAFTVRPSLSRRRSANLSLEGSSVKNAGTRKVFIEYLQIAADRFHVLDPPLALNPGEAKPLPLPAGVDPGAVAIPVAGVLHEASSELTGAGDFVIADPSSAFETVTLQNLIPARLEARRQSVRFVEVQVEQLAGAGEPFEVTDSGKHRLAPESLPGATKTIKFLRPRGAPRRYRVSGRIEYLGGGSQPLAARVFESILIDIDETWLPAAPGGGT